MSGRVGSPGMQSSLIKPPCPNLAVSPVPHIDAANKQKSLAIPAWIVYINIFVGRGFVL